MHHKDLLDKLQNLTNHKPTQQEIADILKVSINTIGGRASRNSKYSLEELQIIEKHFRVSLLTSDYNSNIKTEHQHACCYDVPYWEELSDELKIPAIPSCCTDIDIATNYWGIDYHNLRLIPMMGNSLNDYIYPIRNRDVVEFDISITDLNKGGVFVFTTQNGKCIYIRKLNLLPDGSVEIVHYDTQIPKVTMTLTPEMQKEVNFKVIGRVLKNMTFRM